MAKFKNIVFDLGGVVVARDPRKVSAEFQEFFSFIYQIPMPRFWEEYDRGTSPLEEVKNYICEHNDCSRELCDEYIATAINLQEEIAPTKALIEQLKAAGYRLYVLSNMSPEFIDFIRRLPVYANFDGEVRAWYKGAYGVGAPDWYTPFPVQYGNAQEIDAWMALVRRIAWNFPGLETEDAIGEHRQTVLRFMGKHQALCVKDGDSVIGVMLFSRGHNMICCLGVDPDHRRRGIASALLRTALAQLDASRPISVSTFREEDEKGVAPRALYKKFGFTEAELLTEFGYPNQRFILYPDATNR